MLALDGCGQDSCKSIRLVFGSIDLRKMFELNICS